MVCQNLLQNQNKNQKQISCDFSTVFFVISVEFVIHDLKSFFFGCSLENSQKN